MNMYEDATHIISNFENAEPDKTPMIAPNAKSQIMSISKTENLNAVYVLSLSYLLFFGLNLHCLR